MYGYFATYTTQVGIVNNHNQSSVQVITVGNGTSERTIMFGSLKEFYGKKNLMAEPTWELTKELRSKSLLVSYLRLDNTGRTNY